MRMLTHYRTHGVSRSNFHILKKNKPNHSFTICQLLNGDLLLYALFRMVLELARFKLFSP